MTLITRTTSMMRVETLSRNLQKSAQQYAELQNQATTRKRITAPSDDPSGASNLMTVRADQTTSDQYSRNIADAIGWLTTVDTSLSTLNSQLSRVRDLTVQGANDGTMSPQAKEGVALELEQIRNTLFNESNNSYLGRSIYAGTSDAGKAFNADYSYNGVAGSKVERRVADGKTVQVDADGASVFGVGPNSMFATIDKIISDLRSGVNVNPRLNEIDKHLNDIRDEQSTIGSRHGATLVSEELLAGKKIDLEGLRSNLEDVNLEEVIMKLTKQDTAYQTALSVTAKSTQHSLMDFLR